MPKNINSLGIIPARFASTRFPGKPLVQINGKSMIQRVYEQALKSQLDAIIVATDDQRIFDHIKDSNGRVCMTSSFHKSGTDRCAEVAALPEFSDVKTIVNIQGDEPFIHPAQINKVVSVLNEKPQIEIATLIKKISSTDQLFNANTVKVLFDKKMKALYFSRSAIPHIRGEDEKNWLSKVDFYKHLGIYAFRRKTLLEVAQLPPSKLEVAESLEQLRWLENGLTIGVETTDLESISIDTPADL